MKSYEAEHREGGMTEDEKFDSAFKTGLVCTTVIALAIGGCTAHDNHVSGRVLEAFANAGANPIDARCAILSVWASTTSHLVCASRKQ